MRLTKRLVLSACVLIAFAVSPAYAGLQNHTSDIVFNVSLELISSINVKKMADLNFGQVLMGGDKNVVVNPKSRGAASFRVSCKRNARIRAKVVESSIKIKDGVAGANNEIVVNDWSYSIGAHDDAGRGKDRRVRVGGVAHILDDTAYGNYSGSATLRITYM
ncbi:MAG: DUF4402 domain-containing protein [Coxiellaceae bacterium]|nr:DUF4402 domain-containing protein [Coxiellaceae bacterium]